MYAEAIHIAAATADSMQHYKDYECIWYVPKCTKDVSATFAHYLNIILLHIFGTVVTYDFHTEM